MRVTFLGVRGSTAAPGAEFVRYGGHTSCVAVTLDAESEPSLVLDAGTGLRQLTTLLQRSAFNGAILLSHLHWDHMQGIPFFVAGDRPQARADVFVPAQDGQSGRNLVAQSMSPPAFPITPEGMGGAWSWSAIEPGHHEIEGFSVTAVDVKHKGGRTYGYRVEAEGGSLAYIPDHSLCLGETPETLELIRGVDLLIHDAQNLASERAIAELYGHAVIDDVLDLARRADVGQLALFHHGPARTDDELDRIADAYSSSTISVTVAREGASIRVAPVRSHVAATEA
ncbi:MAG: MBL fold metallo-hydrolase [Actinomycetales bacterium]